MNKLFLALSLLLMGGCSVLNADNHYVLHNEVISGPAVIYLTPPQKVKGEKSWIHSIDIASGTVIVIRLYK